MRLAAGCVGSGRRRRKQKSAMPTPRPEWDPDLAAISNGENANRQRRLIDASPLAGLPLAGGGRGPRRLLRVSGFSFVVPKGGGAEWW
jgi:hypothetical protein